MFPSRLFRRSAVAALLGASFGLAAAATTYTPSSGSLTNTSKQGITGFGISGGATGDEIDVGEFLDVGFGGPSIVASFSLGVLYDGPEFGDPHEIASFAAYLGDKLVASYTFTATGTATGVLTGPGNWLNLSPAAQPCAGLWTISNPFGALTVDHVVFTALDVRNGGRGNNSDFILGSISATPVPEPGSVGLMLAGLAVIGFVARRRRPD